MLREDGSRSTVASYAPAFALEPGTWYTVSASAVGNRITCQIMRGDWVLGSAEAVDDTYGDGYFATWNYKATRVPTGGATCVVDAPPPAARRLRGSR